MNWILLSPPPLSSDPDNPLKFGTCTNKYMKEYNEKAPSKYIMYLDANDLYGWAMSQYLPTANFRWMTDKEINKIDLGKYKKG